MPLPLLLLLLLLWPPPLPLLLLMPLLQCLEVYTRPKCMAGLVIFKCRLHAALPNNGLGV